MKLIWHDTAWAAYLYWQMQDKKTLKRINNLLKDIERNGYNCIGKPEPLKGDFCRYMIERMMFMVMISDHVDKSLELKNSTECLSCGNEYLGKSEYELAIEEYSKAIKLDSDNFQAYSNRGFAYLNLKKYNQAIKDFDKAIQLNPNDIECYEHRETAYRNIVNNLKMQSFLIRLKKIE